MNASVRGCGLTVLRIVVGIVYLAHGYQKVFVAGFGAVGGMFAKSGIPAPHVMGVAIAVLELAGGIALIAGLFARWFAVLFAIEMAVAILKVHLHGGFFMPRGIEFALTLLAANLALAIEGAGKLQLRR